MLPSANLDDSDAHKIVVRSVNNSNGLRNNYVGKALPKGPDKPSVWRATGCNSYDKRSLGRDALNSRVETLSVKHVRGEHRRVKGPKGQAQTIEGLEQAERERELHGDQSLGSSLAQHRATVRAV
tara:strand:- start:343 stop:717 length:375 start_codon:yes stop_codon:yes gene_type:complete